MVICQMSVAGLGARSPGPMSGEGCGIRGRSQGLMSGGGSTPPIT